MHSSSRRHSRRVSCHSHSKSPRHKSHKKHHKHHNKENAGLLMAELNRLKCESAHNLKFKDLEAAENEKADGDNGETKSTACSFKLWGGLAFMLLAIAGVVVFIMFSGASDDVPITEDIMDAYGIDDADKYNPDTWINALKEFPQRKYTLDLVPPCRIAISLMKKQPEDPNFEKKMSILYHFLAHIYYFTYSGQGIDATRVRRQPKYGDLLMKVFQDWSTSCPNVKNPWMYKKCILKTPSSAEFNMADYSIRNRETQIEEASVMIQESTKEYNFLDQYDRSDYEW